MKKLYLALSCLQGQPMQKAAEELISLNPYGLQLTPGNVPTIGIVVSIENALARHEKNNESGFRPSCFMCFNTSTAWCVLPHLPDASINDL